MSDDANMARRAFDDCAATVAQAITAASAAVARGKVCDLSPLGEMIDTLCEEAKAVAADADQETREDIGRHLETVARRMDELERQLRELVEQAGDLEDKPH